MTRWFLRKSCEAQAAPMRDELSVISHIIVITILPHFHIDTNFWCIILFLQLAFTTNTIPGFAPENTNNSCRSSAEV